MGGSCFSFALLRLLICLTRLRKLVAAAKWYAWPNHCIFWCTYFYWCILSPGHYSFGALFCRFSGRSQFIVCLTGMHAVTTARPCLSLASSFNSGVRPPTLNRHHYRQPSGRRTPLWFRIQALAPLPVGQSLGWSGLPKCPVTANLATKHPLNRRAPTHVPTTTSLSPRISPHPSPSILSFFPPAFLRPSFFPTGAHWSPAFPHGFQGLFLRGFSLRFTFLVISQSVSPTALRFVCRVPLFNFFFLACRARSSFE